MSSNAVYSLGSGAPLGLAGGNTVCSATRRKVIDDLRTYIRRVEGGADFASATPSPQAGAGSWTLGIAAIDDLLGPLGLDPGGVHEIRSEAPADGMGAAAATAARRIFALLLGVRRLHALERPGPLLWCLPAAAAHETGMPYSRGLAALGLDPDRVIIASPRKNRDVLWVVEEAVKAGCLSLVLGEVQGGGVTAARRLSLAAAEGRTPCVLVSPAGQAAVTATATRWRVLPRLSGVDALDPAAPGAHGFAIALERCRARPLVSGALDFAVEWSDAARCFRMAAAVSDRALAAGVTAGRGRVRAELARRIA